MTKFLVGFLKDLYRHDPVLTVLVAFSWWLFLTVAIAAFVSHY